MDFRMPILFIFFVVIGIIYGLHDFFSNPKRIEVTPRFESTIVMVVTILVFLIISGVFFYLITWRPDLLKSIFSSKWGLTISAWVIFFALLFAFGLIENRTLAYFKHRKNSSNTAMQK